MKKIKILCSIILTVLTFGIMCSLEATAAGTDFSNAMSISVNTQYKENISKSTEKDFYKFTLSSPGSIYINFKHENLFDKNEYWSAAILDEETNEISYYSFSGTDTNVETYKIGLPSGNYYLRIRGGAWHFNEYSQKFSDKTYTFNLKYTESSCWEKENNESFMSATKVKLNKSYIGSINDKYDVDFYEFTLSSDGSIYLDFKHENLYNKGEFWTATIFNVETTEISSYCFYGSDTSINTQKIGLEKGVYYIRVRGGSWHYNGYSNQYSNATYTFNLNFSESSYWEKENDDSFQTADKVMLGKSYYGSINDKYDIDYFSFTLNQNSQIKVAFKAEVQGSDAEFYLVKIYDTESKEIICKSVYGNKELTEVDLSLSSGEYYIRVSGGSWHYNGYSGNYTDADYNFKITIQVPSPTNLKYSYSISTIKLAWDKVSGATGYKVYQYNTKTKKYVEIADTKKTSYKISKLKTGTKYKYAVRAYLKEGGATYYSSYAKISAATAPAQVANLKFTSTAKKTGVVSYSKVSGASGYQIYYSTSKNGTYKKLATTSNTKYTNKKFSSGKTYYVKVRAYTKVDGKTVYGAYSAVKAVKIK